MGKVFSSNVSKHFSDYRVFNKSPQVIIGIEKGKLERQIIQINTDIYVLECMIVERSEVASRTDVLRFKYKALNNPNEEVQMLVRLYLTKSKKQKIIVNVDFPKAEGESISTRSFTFTSYTKKHSKFNRQMFSKDYDSFLG